MLENTKLRNYCADTTRKAEELFFKLLQKVPLLAKSYQGSKEIEEVIILSPEEILSLTEAGFRNSLTTILNDNVLTIYSAKQYQLRQVIGSKGDLFTRNFYNTLLQTIHELQTHFSINKNKINSFILNKYLGIDIQKEDWVSVIRSQAYYSVPNEENLDYELHQFFLQPEKLFNLYSYDYRYELCFPKTESSFPKWGWKIDGDYQRIIDVAPIFRMLIQAYLLSSTLDGPNDNKESKEIQSKCEKLLKNLILKIENNINELISYFNAPDNAQTLDFNEYTDLESSSKFNINSKELKQLQFTALGRIIAGEEKIEAYHQYASENLSGLHKFRRYAYLLIKRHLSLVTHHLDLWASFAFLNKMIARDFIPVSFYFSLMPISILFSWLFGLTSIPFTALRIWTTHLKLRAIYTKLEFLKDVMLFGFLFTKFYGFVFNHFPLLNVIAINTAQLFIYGLILPFTDNFMVTKHNGKLEYFASTYVSIKNLRELKITEPGFYFTNGESVATFSKKYANKLGFKILGLTMILSGLYLLYELYGRKLSNQIKKYLPNIILKAYHKISNVITSIINKFKLHHEIPLHNKMSKEIIDKAQQCLIKLYQLKNAPNHQNETLFENYISSLNTDNEEISNEINQEIKKANILIENSFKLTNEKLHFENLFRRYLEIKNLEGQIMTPLDDASKNTVGFLPMSTVSLDSQLIQTEIKALKIARGLNQPYIPSFKALECIHHQPPKEFINQDEIARCENLYNNLNLK